jgi:hypothetical protein
MTEELERIITKITSDFEKAMHKDHAIDLIKMSIDPKESTKLYAREVLELIIEDTFGEEGGRE